MLISQSVGQGGVNRQPDVFLVQRLVNDANCKSGQVLLKIDGIAGPKTIAAIKHFQKFASLPVDGRVDPNGPALKKLVNDFVQRIAVGMNVVVARQGTLPKVSEALYLSAVTEAMRAMTQSPRQ